MLAAIWNICPPVRGKRFTQIGEESMSVDFDVIVVGSGPAGVSVAFPLIEAGLKVLIVDGGRDTQTAPPSQPYLVGRAVDDEQWRWMVGEDYHALRNANAVSPKLRVPLHSYVFDGFADANKIDAKDFIAVGSMARGGLSNAWGCGVARLSSEELKDFPFPADEIQHSYATVTRRIGVSGALGDDLSEYFGLDEWADQPIQLDGLHSRILTGYAKKKQAATQLGFKMGRSRVAVLRQDRGNRKACDISGNCLWGCHRRAMYSATEDLELLKQSGNYSYRSGFVVERVVRVDGLPAVTGSDMSGYRTLTARKVILAAGTLGTTRLALQAINLDRPVSMQACPTAAFMLWLPAVLGCARETAFGLGQLSFTLAMDTGGTGFGSLFSTVGIPVAEFARYMPFRKRYGLDLLKVLMSSCVVGNMFLPGSLSTATLRLSAAGTLLVEGGYSDEVNGLMQFSEQRLRQVFWKLGAFVLPRSFTVGKPGSDIHYACSFPMRANPVPGETDAFGEIFGMDDVYIVDGASLSMLTEKSHTLTIMANADRIGRYLTRELKSCE
jgi:hypothetical protein